MAQRIGHGDIPLENIRLTLALFGGEEVDIQDSRAYALSRDWKLPASVLNLEIMAQEEDYVTWEQDGIALKLFPTDEALSRSISAAVTQVTGPINSDGYPFIHAKIPLAVLGAYDSVI